MNSVFWVSMDAGWGWWHAPNLPCCTWGVCSMQLLCQIGGIEFLCGFKGSELDPRISARKRTTWHLDSIPHIKVRKLRRRWLSLMCAFPPLKHIQANACLCPWTFRDWYIRGCVLFVNKGPTFRKESKNCSDRRHLQTVKNPRECCHCCDCCDVLERNLHQPKLFRSLVWQRQVSLFLKYPPSRCQANKPAKNPKYAQVTLAFSCSLTSTSHVTNIHRRHSLFEIYSSSIRICCFVLCTQVRFPLKVTQAKTWEAKARRVAGSPKPSFPANLGELWSLECVQDPGLEQEILWRQRGNQPTLQAKAQCWMALLSGYQTAESYLQNFVVVWNDPLHQDKVVCFGRDMTAYLSNRVAMSHTNIQNTMAAEVQKASMKPSVWAGHVSPP